MLTFFAADIRAGISLVVLIRIVLVAHDFEDPLFRYAELFQQGFLCMEVVRFVVLGLRWRCGITNGTSRCHRLTIDATFTIKTVWEPGRSLRGRIEALFTRKRSLLTLC